MIRNLSYRLLIFSSSLLSVSALSGCKEKTSETPSPPAVRRDVEADFKAYKGALDPSMLAVFTSDDGKRWFEFRADERFVTLEDGKRRIGRYRVVKADASAATLKVRLLSGIEIGAWKLSMVDGALVVDLGERKTPPLKRTNTPMPKAVKVKRKPGLQRFFFGNDVGLNLDLKPSTLSEAQTSSLKKALTGDWQQDVSSYAERPEFKRMSPGTRKRSLTQVRLMAGLLQFKLDADGTMVFVLGPMQQSGAWKLYRVEDDGRIAVELTLKMGAESSREIAWFKREGELLHLLSADGAGLRFGRRSDKVGTHSRGHDDAAHGAGRGVGHEGHAHDQPQPARPTGLVDGPAPRKPSEQPPLRPPSRPR